MITIFMWYIVIFHLFMGIIWERSNWSNVAFKFTHFITSAVALYILSTSSL